METKEIKINCPEGFEIDKENSTFECIKFKPINKELPKTWEEYCRTHRRREGEAWVHFNSKLLVINELDNANRDYIEDRNLLPSKEYAGAMLALCQLIQLRDCYNDGWVPDWTRADEKYTIYVTKNILVENTNIHVNCILAFKTEELRDEFFNNFINLLEVAKPLL